MLRRNSVEIQFTFMSATKASASDVSKTSFRHSQQTRRSLKRSRDALHDGPDVQKTFKRRPVLLRRNSVEVQLTFMSETRVSASDKEKAECF